MIPQAKIIGRLAIDFNTFLGAAYEVLGYSPAKAVDQSNLNRSDEERFISCLAALRDEKAAAGLSPHHFNQLAFSVMVIADERDLLEIVEYASLPIATAETISRGVMFAVMFGTLAQWRDAITAGSTTHTEPNVRHFFNTLHNKFDSFGLGGVWKDFQPRQLADRTFLLEDKRKQ